MLYSAVILERVGAGASRFAGLWARAGSSPASGWTDGKDTGAGVPGRTEGKGHSGVAGATGAGEYRMACST